MNYELFTAPRCEDCNQAKDYLAQRGVLYENRYIAEVDNEKRMETKRRLGQLRQELGDKLKITQRGQIDLPLLVESNGKGVERFAQKYDGIVRLLSQ